MELMDKLKILTAGAKFDAACTSSGANRPGKTVPLGCCHSFSADGRCISLLKVLLTNKCIHDCKYCINRATNDVPRTEFTPGELAELTIQFYRRNYIEGLFLSSGVMRNPDYTMEQLIKTLHILRNVYKFQGYIHAKTIPGCSPALISHLGLLADRLSVNIELPSEESLNLLAPGKKKNDILAPMKLIRDRTAQSKTELALYKSAPAFATAGQATQMIIGASPETDYRIMRLSSSLYEKYGLKRVFYSAYIPAVEDSLLPATNTPPPLFREHRLYQADWLLRQYDFTVDEILNDENPNFNPYLDPKCNWAVNNMHFFPVDVNVAPLRDLLRVPGIGPTSARRIVVARKTGKLGMGDLKRIGVVLKRAQYFITAGDYSRGIKLSKDTTVRALIDPQVFSYGMEQLSLFDTSENIRRLPEAKDAASVSDAVEEAVLCLAANL
jgi:putative DNA modification/repair radical SAM protein